MNDEFNNNQNNNDEQNNNDMNQTPIEVIDVDAIVTDVKPKKHKAVKSFAKIVASAMVFGLVTGVTLQGYNYFSNNNYNNEGLLGQSIDETASNSDVAGGLVNAEADQETVGNAVAVETGTTQSNVTSDVSTVVENVMPSIVAINSTINSVTSDMFGREYSQEAEGSGSGIIIGQNDTELLIATNNHVVEGAVSVEIVFADDTTAPATIKGTAAGSDLAVVSVKLSDLAEGTIDNIKIATLGDSTNTKLGEMAIAIGNALGYGQSVTVGYISALDREVTVDEVTLNLIQTDAAINPGNSGGALLNSKGEVIGINSVKYIDDSVESIGYAIPISDAIPIINELMNRTTLADDEIAYLGIKGKDVTDVYAQSFNMPIGIYVDEVTAGSAAETAGMKVGDIIVSLNDTDVATMSDLQEVLGYTKAGTTGTVIVKSLDNGTYVEKTLTVTFDARPSSN
jgi:serine protease Do